MVELKPLAPREGRWIARPRAPAWILPLLVPALTCAATYPLILVPIQGSTKGVLKFLLVVAAFLLIIGVSFAASIHDFRKPTPRRRGAITVPDGVTPDEFTVEVTVAVKGKRIGADRGVLWFADGLMGFSGSATSFLLAAWDFELMRAARASTMAEPGVPSGALLLLDAPLPAYLLVRVLGPGTAAFTRRLRRFERESASESAERSWPPLHPFEEPRAIESVVRS